MTKISVTAIDNEFGNAILAPSDVDSSAFLNGLSGKMFVIDIKGSRNPRQHRLLWGLLNFAVDHSDYYANSSDLLTQIKYHLNMIDSIKVHGSNDVMIIPRSISFESMSQADFKNFLDEAIRIITEKLVPNLDGDSLNEYYKILDGEK